MAAVICTACSMENDFESVKCEYCKFTLSEKCTSEYDECEDDFRFIEEAELNGKVYNLETFDGRFQELEPCEGNQITQFIKHEPDIDIQTDFVINDNETKDETFTKSSPAKQLQYQCSECSKSFKRKATLRAHLNAAHYQSDSESERLPSKTKSRQTSSKTTPRIFNCKWCNKITKGLEQHLKHVKSHEEEEEEESTSEILSLKCLDCSKTFSSKFDLKVHRNQHEGKTVYQCDECKVFLSNENILKQHKEKLHSQKPERFPNDKKFKCIYCGEGFPLQILMVNHKKTHTEDAKQIHETAIIDKVSGRIAYTCKLCGKFSSNKSRHTDHLRVHTKERPFKCEVCGAAFTARSSLIQHERLHSDERPYKCNICGKTYRHKKNLRNHLIKHTGVKPFTCDYCDKTFVLKTTLADHERLLHTGETPYQCEVCALWFKTSFLLNGHKRKKHDIDTNSKPRVKILINTIASSDDESSS